MFTDFFFILTNNFDLEIDIDNCVASIFLLNNILLTKFLFIP